MKNLLIIFMLFVGINASAQESVIDIIAKKTCEYLQSAEVVNLTGNKKTVKLGAYIINQYSEHKEALIAEGIEFDFLNESSGREFGEKVGMNMVRFCPEALVALASNEDPSEKSERTQFFIGEILSINGSEFSFIQVKGSSGITQKFLWLANFIGSERFISQGADAVIGTTVKVIYKNTECFSPKLNEYIIRKEIVEIEYLN